jgi:hypothetical protein
MARAARQQAKLPVAQRPAANCHGTHAACCSSQNIVDNLHVAAAPPAHHAVLAHLAVGPVLLPVGQAPLVGGGALGVVQHALLL